MSLFLSAAVQFRKSLVSDMVALDGVFLIVVDSVEPHGSTKLAGVAFFCTEATGDVVVVGWRRCVVVGWGRRLQTCLTGMNVKNYDDLCGRTAPGGEGVVQRGKEHVARCDVAEL